MLPLHPLTYSPSPSGMYPTRGANPPQHPELWAACQEFEALLIQQMLRAMSSTLTSGSFFGAAAGSGIYQEMYEQELASAMSRSGGVGLASILYKQVSRES